MKANECPSNHKNLVPFIYKMVQVQPPANILKPVPEQPQTLLILKSVYCLDCQNAIETKFTPKEGLN